VFTPTESHHGHIEWSCSGGTDLRPSQVPAECQGQPLPSGI
jgi:hypothetical protein